jgi:hypothetical protein
MDDDRTLLEKAASHVDGAWLLVNVPLRESYARLARSETLARDWPITRKTLEAALERARRPR